LPYNTSDFLTEVRLRGNIPDTSNDDNVNSDNNILKLATSLFHSKLYPRIQSTRGDYYVATKDYSITSAQANYEVPSRATGLIVRDIFVLTGSQLESLPSVEPEYITSTATGCPVAYYFEHNNIVLYPTPSSTSGTLRLKYYLRPSRLADIASCAQISAIDTVLGRVTVSSIPSTWSTTTELDFVKKTVPYALLAMDQTPSAVASTVLTFSSLPTGLAVGDWVAPAEYTPIPQLPFELIPVLSQMTAVKVLEAMGDRDGNNVAWKDLQDDLEQALKLITPRNHGQPTKIVSRRW